MDAYTIVGLGGIGCTLGYALRSAGARVTCVEVDLDKLRWGQTCGLGLDRRPPLHAELVAFEDWRAEKHSNVILCTKCYDNARVLARMPEDLPVLPVQNGFDPLFENRGEFPEGIASFVSECLPGRTHTRLTRMGALYLGIRRNGRPGVRRDLLERELGRLAQLLRRAAIFPVKVVDNILAVKHTKLMYNAAISPIAAAAGLDNGQLLSSPLARRLFFALLAENYTILQRAGMKLHRIGPFHPDTVHEILKRPWLARTLTWAFYPSLRGSYCSMHGDLPRGRSEMDNYNRYLIDLAGPEPCPYNQRVYEIVKQMEQERINPGPHMLKRLVNACAFTPPELAR